MVGNAGFSAGATWFTSLALDSSGTPYVAYPESANGNKASVMKFVATPAGSSVNLTPVYQLLLKKK
jgi:hypothetical protein